MDAEQRYWADGNSDNCDQYKCSIIIIIIIIKSSGGMDAAADLLLLIFFFIPGRSVVLVNMSAVE